MDRTTRKTHGNRTSRMLQAIQLLFLVTAVAVVVKIVMLQFFYRPSEKETAYYGTPE